MADLTDAQIAYLESQRLGRLATAGADGKPHVVPVSFRYNRETKTIDLGGMHVARTKRFRDVQANPYAAFVVDDLASIDPWTPRMVEMRGRVEAHESGGESLGPGFAGGFLRLHLDKVNSYGV
jgi:pyridoxamine 5'-phosphate oxidase family protein